ncbi:MAG: ATP-dependent zinc metalloprotease FtsH [Candidatus Obscuribacter phosphatis]|uniref:ATP-dependent zinc metalloprotease FtsH n=1 Tax=Candidatus Obscuribacter phosphatis TaxID=1906157 RepID=A0A8J7P815_9BACT|nr:ATP-dependent zinc metalloprotease FtsH [Candidatus Obscuribacter phosphatis]
MKKYGTTWVILLALLLLVIFTLSLANLGKRDENLTYFGFTSLLREGKASEVKKVTYTNGENVIYVQLQNPESERERPVVVPMEAKEELLKELGKAGVNVEVKDTEKSQMLLGMLSTFLLPIVLVIGFLLMVRSAQSGGNQAMSFGRSRAKLMMDNKVKVCFNDVAGIDEAKQELQEIVDFLKSPEKFTALGARIPRGVLLVGSPGTGKTLLAKAVAGEAGVPFFSISGSDFVEMFVGVGASRVRDLFEQAKKQAPCIVFVDEIDAVGRQRGAGLGGGHDEREQTLNQLLVEMDGFEGSTGIIVVAATNRPDILDSALLRPGRFDRQVVIDRPDVKGREQILNVHGKGKPLAKDVDLKILARRTPGFTGADLSNLINEAALIAARADKREIEMGDLELAIDKVQVGAEKRSRVIPPKEKEMTAFHEVGHALMHLLLKNVSPLHKVTIIPRGFALGITWSVPDEDLLSMTSAMIYDQIGVLLGGRVAEEVVYGDVTTGAQNDLERSTALARRMVTEYGMSERLGPMTFGKRNGQVFLGRDFGHERDYSENIATAIDEEVSEIISKQYSRVKELLLAHRPHLNAIVKVLLEKETLDRAEVEAIMDEVNRKLAAGEDPDSSSPDSPDNDSNSNEPPAVIVTREEEKVPVKETKPERDGGDSSPGLTPKFA